MGSDDKDTHQALYFLYVLRQLRHSHFDTFIVAYMSYVIKQGLCLNYYDSLFRWFNVRQSIRLNSYILYVVYARRLLCFLCRGLCKPPCYINFF